MHKQVVTVFLGFILCACVATPAKLSVSAPKSVQKGMVVTANPHATRAGAEILRAGGSAVDAAIAIESVLSLVEPQSSGLGGGGFMVHFDNQSKRVTIYDGRETAPKAISATQFLNDSGKSIGFLNAKNSGLSTGVPGMVSMLELAHQDHGRLPWGLQFDAAIALAEEGFAVSPRLNSLIERFGKYIPKTDAQGPTDAFSYLFDEQGQPLAVGAKRDNPAYAKTLRQLAADPKSFYTGAIAAEIVDQVKLSPRAGSLTLDDMQDYQAQKKQALCSTYKGNQLCGPPPPSSWLAVGQIMGLLEAGNGFDVGGAKSASNWVTFAEAQRLAYADRDQYVGDEAFVSVPVDGLLSTDYWSERVRAADKKSASEVLKAGDPWRFEAKKKVAYAEDQTVDVAGTTHFVVVDAQGDVVSMTASVESIFGSTRMAGGMFLNNQLTDFSFYPTDEDGRLVANRIEAGKRPRSSMSPTIALDKKGDFLMATGSPGGNSIIAYTAKTLVAVFDWGLTPQQAVELPNMVARGEKVRIEKERADAALIQGLKDYGFNVHESAGENSGLSVIYRNADGVLEGGVDPRREGVIEIVEF